MSNPATSATPPPPSACPFCDYATRSVEHPQGLEWAGALEQMMVFPPLSPATPGHLMVVPARHVESVTDLTLDETVELWWVVANVVADVRVVHEAEGMNIVVQESPAGGQSVRHLHVHVVPRREGDGLGYQWGPSTVPEPAVAAVNLLESPCRRCRAASGERHTLRCLAAQRAGR